jgi:homoserine dehydrogenase
VAICSDRYCNQPLVIQGPGAGAEVTAAALIDDVLRIGSDYR